jgi:hypothetical protein
MGNWGYRPTPLRLHTCWKKNHKTCEDNLADHCDHLKTQPAEPLGNEHHQQPIATNKDAPATP